MPLNILTRKHIYKWRSKILLHPVYFLFHQLVRVWRTVNVKGSLIGDFDQNNCYYAYSWYLTLYGEQLAPFQFEAWVHGPVSRELYHYYKLYGWSDIPQYHGLVMVDNEMLEQMSHKEYPWQAARGTCRYYESSDTLLDDDEIIAYFSKNKDFFISA